MAAEFFIVFDDIIWYKENLNKIIEKTSQLETFLQKKGDELWLSGREGKEEKYRWVYDVRFIFSNAQHILMEISAHPKSIEADLALFFNWLRSVTAISIVDEDDVISNW